MADNTPALQSLNSDIGYLPQKTLYGEIVYHEVPMGHLTLGYTIFDHSIPPTIEILPRLSHEGEQFLMDVLLDADLIAAESANRGDGLIPAANQLFTTIPGFSGKRITPLIRVDGDVVHTAEPSQTSDLKSQLRALVDWWN